MKLRVSGTLGSFASGEGVDACEAYSFVFRSPQFHQVSEADVPVLPFEVLSLNM